MGKAQESKVVALMGIAVHDLAEPANCSARVGGFHAAGSAFNSTRTGRHTR